MDPVVEKLLSSEEPSVRYKTLVNVLGRKPDSAEAKKAREAIPSCERVLKLFGERDAKGEIPCHPYAKWRGAHWLLATLADMGYPPGDKSLLPLSEQVLGWLVAREKAQVIDGRVRWCASLESNGAFSTLALGLADDRVDQLAERMIERQWPDGGWNCDKSPDAHNSSFHETLIPLRALSLYAKLRKSAEAKAAADRAAEVFLKRRLFRRLRDGEVMCPRFLEFHFPRYWHYDLLFGLVVMAETGRIRDPRCADALDFLQAKQLPAGGWAADAKWYRVRKPNAINERAFGRTGFSGQSSLADWKPTGKTRMNEFVTVDALYVLKEAGRLS